MKPMYNEITRLTLNRVCKYVTTNYKITNLSVKETEIKIRILRVTLRTFMF